MTRVIEIDGCTLYHGDTFSILPGLDLKANSLISDFPFSCTNLAWDIKLPLEATWELMESKTTQSATFILFATLRFAVDLINTRRDFFRYDLVWNKNRKCGFLWAGHQPLRNHELILCFTRPGEFKNATYNALRTPGGRIGSRSVTRKADGVYGFTNNYTSVSDGLLHPSSILNFDSDRGNNHGDLHPTAKPVALMQWLVETYTNEGDLVIDPFMGSGTTARACQLTGRRFIGIEKEERYFEMVVERLKAPRQTCLFTDSIGEHSKNNFTEIMAIAS